MTGEIELSTEMKNDVLVFRVGGRLDSVSSKEFEELFAESIQGEECNKVLINLEMLNYISSSGLQLLHAQTKELKEKNSRLIICSPSENILDVIKMVGFDSILNIQNTEKEGLAAF